MRYLTFAFIFIATSLKAQVDGPSLASPNGRLTIHFQTVATNHSAADAGQLVYDVAFQGKRLLNPSALSLTLQGERALGANVRIANTTRSQTDENYTLITGKANRVRNRFNALRLELEEPDAPQRKLIVEARAYDDAIAFRYVVPEQSGLNAFRLGKENTEFRISMDAMCYALVLPNFQSQYESEFVKLPASAFSPLGIAPKPEVIGLPLLMQFPGIGSDF